MSTSDAAPPTFETEGPSAGAVPRGDVRVVLQVLIDVARIGLDRVEAVLHDDEAWTRLARTVSTMSALATPVARHLVGEVIATVRSASPAHGAEPADAAEPADPTEPRTARSAKSTHRPTTPKRSTRAKAATRSNTSAPAKPGKPATKSAAKSAAKSSKAATRSNPVKTPTAAKTAGPRALHNRTEVE
jgi:hypothetical protein